MKNLPQIIAWTGITVVMGVTGLALAQANYRPLEFTKGNVQNYHVDIISDLKNSSSRLYMNDGERMASHFISASDSDGDGVFELINFDGMRLSDSTPLRKRFENIPLFAYTNQDSLSSVYNHVLQNRKK